MVPGTTGCGHKAQTQIYLADQERAQAPLPCAVVVGIGGGGWEQVQDLVSEEGSERE